MNWSVGNFSLSGPWKILYKVVCKKMYEVVREKIIMKWSVKIFMTWSETKKWCICASLIRPKTGTMEERDNTRKEGENYKPFRSFCRKNKDFSWSFAKNRGIQFGIMRCILCSLLFRKNFPTGGNLRIGRARPSREFLVHRIASCCTLVLSKRMRARSAEHFVVHVQLCVLCVSSMKRAHATRDIFGFAFFVLWSFDCSFSPALKSHVCPLFFFVTLPRNSVWFCSFEELPESLRLV